MNNNFISILTFKLDIYEQRFYSGYFYFHFDIQVFFRVWQGGKNPSVCILPRMTSSQSNTQGISDTMEGVGEEKNGAGFIHRNKH
jgi:hypothetical protein